MPESMDAKESAMPSLPLVQEIYLIGVICAYIIFMVVLAAGAAWSNGAERAPAPARRNTDKPDLSQFHPAE